MGFTLPLPPCANAEAPRTDISGSPQLVSRTGTTYERRIAVARPPKQPGDGASTKAQTKTRRPKLQSGTVTAVQRVNSDFRLNVQS